MPTIQATLNEARWWFSQLDQVEKDREKLKQAFFVDEAKRDEEETKLKVRASECHAKLRALIETHEREPEGHFLRHGSKLKKFYDDKGAYPDSVFVMTKYPAGRGKKARSLQAVIDAVCAAIRSRHYVPRLASDAGHHEMLWDNVELYLLGCGRGVAIVEDKFAAELNPNVAMEWGWMKGMGREVLFLCESTFSHKRADWDGRIEHKFDWANPGPGVEEALEKFLPKRDPAKP